jgi:adenylate kinase family enzyme
MLTPMDLRRIHITGGPGSGKTRLSQRLGEALSLPVFDTDGIGLEVMRDMPRPLDMQALIDRRAQESARLAAEDSWISEGSNTSAAAPFFERADVVIALDCTWRTASFRILARHVKASLARTNRFPGVINLYKFWRWSGRYYANLNPHEINQWGTPSTQSYMHEVLAPYLAKLRVCATNAEIDALIRELTADTAVESVSC